MAKSEKLRRAQKRSERRSSAQAKAVHAQAVARIHSRWAMQRDAAPTGRGRHGPHDQFKRDVYRLIRIMIDRNWTALLREAARDQAVRTSTRVPRSDNIFAWGLFAILEPDELPRAMRHAWASEMLYAYRHAVRSCLLTAFVKWAGTPTRAMLAAKQLREPGFERASPKRDI